MTICFALWLLEASLPRATRLPRPMGFRVRTCQAKGVPSAGLTPQLRLLRATKFRQMRTQATGHCEPRRLSEQWWFQAADKP
jgi:hypothetical protein